jgi:hypothetical protein
MSEAIYCTMLGLLDQFCTKCTCFPSRGPLPSNTRHTAPSLRLFVPNSLTMHRRSLSSEGCVVTSLSCRCSGFRVVHFPTATSAPSLRPARPEQLRVGIPVSSCSHHHSEVSSSFLLILSHSLHGEPGASTLPAPASGPFFRFGGGRPLHKFQRFTFRDAT